MSFITDKQTLEDLNLTGKYKSGSIFSFFNKVKTNGGEQLLEFMFNNPLTDPALINKRSSIFNYFQQLNMDFPFDRQALEVMENYLTESSSKNSLLSYFGNLKKMVLSSTIMDDQYVKMQMGIRATIQILKTCRLFFAKLDVDAEITHPYGFQILEVKSIFKVEQLASLAQDEPPSTFHQWSTCEHLLKHTFRKELETLIQAIYHLDVYISVGQLSRLMNFSFAHAFEKERDMFVAEELCHPSLAKAVGNHVSFDRQENVIFMTGANMAGKSTLMKTIGISLYLAQMGFPVAAKSMEFSVKDGMYSSINVPDNLSQGLSHFYAEVLRVKKVAEEVSSGKAFMVIFDELFKGTNVKDAYDATLAVTEAFSEYSECFYIISTHIIEVGEALNGNDSIQFLYLPTIMEKNTPRYTYKLEKGITTDRQGMIIIENEGIFDILNKIHAN